MSIHILIKLSSIVVMIPGPMVERKQARTEIPLIQAKMIKVALGRISSPRSEALAIRAQACPMG